MVIHSIAGLIKIILLNETLLYKMGQYFSKPHEPFGEDINVKVDLSNYATRADLKDATGIDTSNFALKLNLASLENEVDKLDIAKLVPVPVDLRNVVKNDVVKKTVYDKIVLKVNNIDISRFPLKTKYDTDKSDWEKKTRKLDMQTKKITDASGLVKEKHIIILKLLK